MSKSWPLEQRRDREARSSLTKHGRQRLVVSEWGVLILATLLVGFASILISLVSMWLATLRQGYCKAKILAPHHECSKEDWQEWPRPVGWAIYLLLSVSYSVAAHFLARLAPASISSGLAELKSYSQGFSVSSNFFSLETLLVKLAGSGLVAAAGLWLGQELPLAHVSAATMALLSQLIPIGEISRRNLVIASASAGVAIAFYAPLGGVLFGIELFITPHNVIWKMFVCAMLACLLLQSVIAPSSSTGGIVVPETGLFHVSYDRVWHAIEMIPFAIIGVLGGLVGAIVPRLATYPAHWYAQRPVLAVVVVSSITSLLGYMTVVSRVPLSELLVSLFAECRTEEPDSMFCSGDLHIYGLIHTLVMGLVLLPASCTLPLPSGVMFPNLVLGALMGRLMGLVMRVSLGRLPVVLSTGFCPDASKPCLTPGVYALVGAGAALTGATKLTISSVILLCEITGALSFIVPIMTGVIVSKWVSDTLIDGDSISLLGFANDSVMLLPDTSVTVPDLYASEIMVPLSNVVAIKQPASNHTVESNRILPSSTYHSVPIIEEGTEKFIDLVVAKTGESEPTIILSPKSSLRLVESSIIQLGIRVVVLCSKGRFVGIVTRRDVVNALRCTKPVVTAASVDEFEIDSD